jgi:hypothetical protein
MRRLPALAALATALALTACGSGSSSDTAAACLQGPSAYLQALEAAPAPVRLEGSVAISDCLAEGQDAGELAVVGQSLVSASTKLNAEARRSPASPAPVELGYLVAAVAKGAEETSGIHDDLVRRVESAARFSPGGGEQSEDFKRGFGRGYAGGQQSG